MSRSIRWIVAMPAVLLAVNAWSAPVDVSILDHRFSFTVPGGVNYEYMAEGADCLSLQVESGHHVIAYTYEGVMDTVPPNSLGVPPAPSPDPYPVAYELQFAGKLDLELHLECSNGPVIGPGGGVYEICLQGLAEPGHMTIMGWIATQTFPYEVLYPEPGAGGMPINTCLLDVTFDEVMVLAHPGQNVMEVVAGIGAVNLLLGVEMSSLSMPDMGACIFEFEAPPGTPLFCDDYDPMCDYGLEAVTGGICGQAGIVPEPAAMGLILVGGSLLLLKRSPRH